ncbi:unnamed protein product, partial [Mesorhabditis spiculigera]
MVTLQQEQLLSGDRGEPEKQMGLNGGAAETEETPDAKKYDALLKMVEEAGGNWKVVSVKDLDKMFTRPRPGPVKINPADVKLMCDELMCNENIATRQLRDFNGDVKTAILSLIIPDATRLHLVLGGGQKPDQVQVEVGAEAEADSDQSTDGSESLPSSI